MKQDKKKSVLVGMSGGVDSAVAAYLLMQQGYDVIAGFMKNYADATNPDCHTRQDRDMALKVSQFLGIKAFIIFDFGKEYNEKIIQYIYDSYESGLTPNPDILCNTEVKFKLFLEKGIELGCDYVATGHYAQVDHDSVSDIYKLIKGQDNNKDQTYFLSGLDQYQLSHSLFPIGHMCKPDVRKLAHEIGLPNADRKDSQGLCFIGKVDMKTFLSQSLPKKPGEIRDADGALLGMHEGAHFYTVGQRQGLGLSGGPRYVIARDVENNIVTVGGAKNPDMYTKDIYIQHLHRLGGTPLHLPLHAQAKIRYRQEDQECLLDIHDKKAGTYVVHFDDEQRASAAGQTVAIYQDDELIASGVIVG